MPDEKGLIQGLMDFSFTALVTSRMTKLLYGLHLFVGLVVAIAVVVNGFSHSTAQGLLMLIVATVGLAFWVLYLRVLLEILVAILRIEESLAVIRSHASQ
jgi:hypothetical protein